MLGEAVRGLQADPLLAPVFLFALVAAPRGGRFSTLSALPPFSLVVFAALALPVRSAVAFEADRAAWALRLVSLVEKTVRRVSRELFVLRVVPLVEKAVRRVSRELLVPAKLAAAREGALSEKTVRLVRRECLDPSEVAWCNLPFFVMQLDLLALAVELGAPPITRSAHLSV
jgi:hypothetical protein